MDKGYQPELGSLRPAVEAVREAAEYAYLDRGSVVLSTDELAGIQTRYDLSVHQAKGALVVGQNMARRSFEVVTTDDETRGM